MSPKPNDARVLERAMSDLGSKVGWLLDQTTESDVLRPHVKRHGMTGDPNWLP
ncbi:MAG: hypothetical protein WCT04_24555 [Planctomycetota bacterium]